MATKQEIVDDIRSLYPGAGALRKADVLRYIKKTDRHPSEFMESLDTTEIDGQVRYLVISIADKLYRSTGGAS